MSPDGVFFAPGSPDGADGGDNYEVREPTQAEFEHWLETGRFTNDPREIPFNMSSAAATGMEHTGVSTGEDPTWLDMIGPFQNKYPGVALRSFHPKKNGYHEMARALQLSVKTEFASDELPVYKQEPEEPKNSIQILVRSTDSKQFSWVAFQGPQGVAVNPCGDDRFWAFANEKFSAVDLQRSSDIDHPPLISLNHIWSVQIDGEYDCRYDSTNGVGHLKCGDYLEYPFADDPKKSEATMNCPGSAYYIHTGYWHRSYYLL
jgi:hypothetical protein